MLLEQTTLEIGMSQTMERKPEIILHELEELRMFNWKRRKFRDLNCRVAMKKRE